MSRLNVISLGPSLLQQGGMAAVENIILRYAPLAVSIKHISTHEEGPGWKKIVVFAKAMLSLIRKLSQHDVDVLHVHFSERACVFRTMVILLIASWFRQPVILHAHGSEFKEFYAKLPKSGKKLVNIIFRKCSRFIALSESWKNYYQETLHLTDKQMVVFANPIEFPVTVPDRKGANLINFVFLGRIGPRKGTFDLIKAFAAMTPEQKAKSRLILAGDGEVEEARKLVKSLDLAGQTSLLGWIDSTQRTEVLTHASAFVLPSYNEGLPMAMLEAMSWGLPAIATPVGGIPEVLSDHQNGLLVEPGDIAGLTQALQSLVEDESLRLTLGRRARQQTAPLAIEEYWNELANLYRAVLV